MSTTADALFERARQLAQTSSFVSSSQLSQLASMSGSQLDALPFGVVKVDGEGNIVHMNTYEADLGGVDARGVEGRNFFTQVAPCTNNNMFLGSFKKGVGNNDLNVLFPYTFTYKMKPTNVKVHMYRDSASGTNWVLVQKS
jgi:photoactive yellow protein